MKKALVLALVLATSNSFAGLENSATEMYSIENVMTTSTTVNLIRTHNVQQTCESESKRRGLGGFRGARMEACSFWSKNTCTIIVEYKTNNDILGHELRHCFQGNFH